MTLTLRGERVDLVLLGPEAAPAVAELHRRNQRRLPPWSPPQPADVATEAACRARLELARRGFQPEGLARDALFLGGRWRDHVLTARRHPGHPGPSA